MIRLNLIVILFHLTTIKANEFINYTLVDQGIEVVLLGQKSFYKCINQTSIATLAYAQGIQLENYPTKPIDERNISFLLYTRKNPIIPEIFNTYNPLRSIENSNFIDFSKQTVLYVHGWLQSNNDTVKKLLPDILIQDDVNLIIVNWDSYSFSALYFTTPRLGRIVGKFGNQLIKAGANAKKLYFIGYSVGGQAVGYAGKVIKPKIGKILAIDPQGNCFNLLPNQFKVSKTDAEFVQIMHCTVGNSGSPLKLLGDVTFYVDGGLIQPQCQNATAEEVSGCSHAICDDYFFLTINYPNLYRAFKCYTYKEYLLHHCNCADTAIMGYKTSTSARGTYFVQTRSAKRLCGYRSGPNPNTAGYLNFPPSSTSSNDTLTEDTASKANNVAT